MPYYFTLHELAKRPNGQNFERVKVLKNYWGLHEDGLQFMDGHIFQMKDCTYSSIYKNTFIKGLRKITAKKLNKQMQEYENS